MPIVEFWEEEPDLLWTYRKSYIEQKKLESEMLNYSAWLNGLYVYDALAVVAHNILAKKGTSPKTYFEKPIELNANISEEEKRKKLEDSIRNSLKQKQEILKRKEVITEGSR